MIILSARAEAGVGLLGLAVCALLATGDWVVSRVMQQMGWPYWRTTAGGYCLSGWTTLAFILVARVSWPSRHHWQWIVARGAFGAAYWGLGVLAVQVGAQPGDVGALMSVNVVFAALLGRLCLKERLRARHAAAIFLSVAGALLISQPAFIFGGDGGGSSAWAGHLVAITAGLSYSCCLICSRHLADIHVAFPTASAFFFSVPLCLLLPVTKIVDEPSIEVLLRSPGESVGWIATTYGLALFAVTGASIGGMLCPVAVSATAYTAATMLIGYLAQILFFGSAPHWLTIIGAVLMLLAVACMAVCNAPPSSPPLDEQDTDFVSREPSMQSGQSASMSLSSFVFLEVCDFAPVSERNSTRMSTRRASRLSARSSVCSSIPGHHDTPKGSRRGSKESSTGTGSQESSGVRAERPQEGGGLVFKNQFPSEKSSKYSAEEPGFGCIAEEPGCIAEEPGEHCIDTIEDDPGSFSI